MANVYGSMFESGHWEWDEMRNGLIFISAVAVSKKKHTEKRVEVQPKNLRVYLDLRFADTMDPKEVATFRRVFYRRVRASEVDTVCLHDVRDVVLYQCLSAVPVDIIDLLHLEAVERFVRALILYMQFFLQGKTSPIRRRIKIGNDLPSAFSVRDLLQEMEPKVMDSLHERAEDREQRMTLGELTHVERMWQRDLHDLRTLIAREHCCLLVAADENMVQFHHLSGGSGVTGSQGERDIRYFEMLWRFAARMVYVALFRRSFSIIEAEMNRLFRSNVFSAHVKRSQSQRKGFEMPSSPRRSVAASTTVNKPKSYEYRTLYGDEQGDKRIFHTHSPACMTALADNDFRILATGNIDFVGRDPRLMKLWHALTLPEELLQSSGVALGILGLPRTAFDSMLTPLNRLTIEEEKDEMERLGVNAMTSSLSFAPTSGGTVGHLTAAVTPTVDDGLNPVPSRLNRLLDTHSQLQLDLPSPGPRVPAPAVFPRQRAPDGLLGADVGTTYGQSIIALREQRERDRAKSRMRWRRWEQIDGRAKRRMSSPPPLEVTGVAQAAANEAVNIVEGLLSRDSESIRGEGTMSPPRSPEESPPTPDESPLSREESPEEIEGELPDFETGGEE